jgi:hypothetical protein
MEMQNGIVGGIRRRRNVQFGQERVRGKEGVKLTR